MIGERGTQYPSFIYKEGRLTMRAKITITDTDGDVVYKSNPHTLDLELHDYNTGLNNVEYVEKDATLIEKYDGKVLLKTPIKVMVRKEDE